MEAHIKAYLTGNDKLKLPMSIPNRKNDGARDKLSRDTSIVNYVSDKKTKLFLKHEILKKDPNIKDKSGQWYWLNYWRKKQIGANIKITYQDLINKLYELMTTKERLPRVPSTRYNNFITDYLADDENNSKQEAIEVWDRLKKLPVKKNYQDYKEYWIN